MNSESLPRSPFERPDVLDLPPVVRKMQDECPVSRFRTMAGDEAWMVTRFAEARQLFADPRLTRSHPDPKNAPKVTNAALLDGSDWGYEDYEAEREAEAAMRALLSKSFSAKRMTALAPRIEGLVDDLLDVMDEQGPPADLVERLARPLPLLVICELLGVPYADRERFTSWSEQVADPVDGRASRAALESLYGYMGELLDRKASEPADDVLSDLATACASGELKSFEAMAMAAGVLFAGHATTVVVIEWGALQLLLHPGQADALRRDESLVTSAVEEVLRRRLSGGEALAHYAGADIEIGGVTIRAGEAVVINVIAANQDPRAFDGPDRFDITRHPNPHLAFGHGRHVCVGRSLARVELRAVFGRLFQRFPALRLAIAPEQLRLHPNPVVGGLTALPVTW
ncbi:cytochrome P450 [Lentzea sp. NPDC005914]|uniref:cytochrome P450 n=1 Tax=Lentzea sp. NPDC005914 TaxID=3154572 RepID=UPI0033E31FE2